jgi:hypothetical protein
MQNATNSDISARVHALDDGSLKLFLLQLITFDGVIVPRHIAVQRAKQKKSDGFGSNEVLAALRAPSIQAELPLPLGDQILPTL